MDAKNLEEMPSKLKKSCQSNLGEPVVAPHHGRKGPPEANNQNVIGCRGLLKIIEGHF